MLIRSEVERQLAVIFFAVIPLARLEGVTTFFQQFASIMKNKAGQSGQWPTAQVKNCCACLQAQQLLKFVAEQEPCNGSSG